MIYYKFIGDYAKLKDMDYTFHRYGGMMWLSKYDYIAVHKRHGGYIGVDVPHQLKKYVFDKLNNNFPPEKHMHVFYTDDGEIHTDIKRHYDCLRENADIKTHGWSTSSTKLKYLVELINLGWIELAEWKEST